MTKIHDYDVVVIGAGIAGMVSAVTANGFGKRVAVVEKEKVGGNCTNLTCIPSKALIRISHIYRELEHLRQLGLETSTTGGLSTREVMPHIRSIVQKAYEKDLPETFERIGINILGGSASFIDSHHILVNDRKYSSEKFIIATGTRPVIPPIQGLENVDYLTNETLYQVNDLPDSLLILGGGVDGLEYASAFGRLGVETTVVEMSKYLLPMIDRELVIKLQRILEDGGIRLLTGAKAVKFVQEKNRVSLTYQLEAGTRGEIQADRVLVAIGRKPDLDGLSLDTTGVKYTSRGIITDNKLRTSTRNIFACGDIVGPYQLASTAEYQGIVAAINAVSLIKKKVDYRNNVYVIFTDPPIAYLGLTEKQAHSKLGDKFKVYRFDYNNMRRALIDGTQNGIAKILTDRRGRIIGAHIIGEAATEVIHEFQVIKGLNQPLHKLHSATHAYPTYAQAIVGRASQLAFLDMMCNSFIVNLGLKIIPGFSNRLHLARERLAETEPLSTDSHITRINILVESESTTDQPFAIRAVCAYGKACIIDLPAELTVHDEEPILSAYAGSRSQESQSMILNFSQVSRMNGLGAGMLIKLAAKSRRIGRKIIGFGISDRMKNVLEVTELDQAMSLCENEKSAMELVGIRESINNISRPEVFLDTQHWAKPVSTLSVPQMPRQARNLNVQGRRTVGPVNGFGQMWQKIFQLSIKDASISPEQAIAVLKAHFAAFQPSFNTFYPSLKGIQPGEIVLIESMTPGGPVATGVMILYADDLSFSFITPQGHPESGIVSFSAMRKDEMTIVQILGLARANDPLYEIAFRTIGSKIQSKIWSHVLTSLALHLGIPANITVEQTCVDGCLQWSQVGNIWHNAQIRTLLWEPFRWLGALFRHEKGNNFDANS